MEISKIVQCFLKKGDTQVLLLLLLLLLLLFSSHTPSYKTSIFFILVFDFKGNVIRNIT